MDTLVYTADISALNAPEVFERLLAGVPAYRREKAMRFRFQSGRMQSLGVGLLLRVACRNLGMEGADENVVLGENGKPEFRDFPDVHFNLSHSKERVMCVVSPCETGCDVERVKEGRSRLAERFFKEPENRWIRSFPEGEAQDIAFCRLWTLKECYMKVTGRGMSLSPDKFTLVMAPDGIKLEHEGLRPEYKFFELPGDWLPGGDCYRYAFCLKDMPVDHRAIFHEINLEDFSQFNEAVR